MKSITAIQVKTITKPGKYRADNGLYLIVKPSGRRSWIQRITIQGKRHEIGLGAYPEVSLAIARKKAFENRTAIEDRRNPLAEKRTAKTPTFREVAVTRHTQLADTWRSDQHTVRWMRSLKKHAMPKLGDLPVDQITKSDVLDVLEPIWHTRPETARRVRQRIRTILEYCQACDFVDHNVAGEAINGALPKIQKVNKHHLAMPYQEMPDTMRLIDSQVVSFPPRLCLKFLILTATRSGEARGVKWSEINFESSTWTVPGDRMKAGKPHRVPLSRSALDVLEEARLLRDDSGLIFPSPVKRGHPLSDMTLMMTLRRCGLADKTVVHGFRSSFRTWALERTDTPWAACEAALAHELGSQVERSYARGDLLDKRRDLMQQWAGYLDGSSQ